MKITEVEALYLRLPEIQARTDSSQDALIVKVSTDAGITGWGEVDGCPYVTRAIIEAPMSHTLVTGLRQLLIGEDPRRIEHLWQMMYRQHFWHGNGIVRGTAISGSPSKSRVPAADSVARNGTVPPMRLADARAFGARFPALYSIRTSFASSLFWNQRLPYSRTYRSPSGPNLRSIGSIGL